jgi:NADH/NAD ratio-sensing transcriptional regulator Rex
VKVPSGVKLKSVDLTVSLESLSFFLAQGRGDE